MPRTRKVKIPDDFDDEDVFVAHVRDLFQQDLDADKFNRDAASEDAEFMVGKQWPEKISKKREKSGKPTLTLNHIPAFIGLLVGNRRLNETVIKVLPDHGGTKDIARIREGLIRSIQKTSRAKRAYDKAYENQIIGGLGAFQVNVEFTNDDVFEQDIVINSIHDPNSVVWDRTSLDPTGRDARHCFVLDVVSKEDYEARWPHATKQSFDDGVRGDSFDSTVWTTENDIRIASFWRMRTRRRTLALTTDGDVEDITDELQTETVDGEKVETIPAKLMERIVINEETGDPVLRDVDKPYAQMYVMSGAAVLEGPYELPISRIPVFRVPGWEVTVGEERHRWGIVRFMKDPMRFMNYWRSVLADKIMRSPKAKFIASDTAVEGFEKEWREAHLSDDTLLRYNGESGSPPTFVPPIQLEPALVQASQMSLEDLKNITNLQDASLGIQSNEVSGKAITARQRVGELGSFIYLDNLNSSIEEAGGVIDELIPLVYDTTREIKILGPDDREEIVKINTKDEGGPDITSGKYAITISTGPSTETKRAEAAEGMLTFMNHAPQTAAIIADLIAEAQDWPNSEKITQRLRMTLPPGMVDQDDLTPEQQQRQQAQQGAQMQQSQAQTEMFQAELDEKRARAREAAARAEEAEARRDKTLSEVGVAARKAQTDAEKAASQSELHESQAELNEAKTVNELVGKEE